MYKTQHDVFEEYLFTAICWMIAGLIMLASCSQKYYRYSHSGEKFKVEHENQKR